MAKFEVIRKVLTSLSEPWCDKQLGQSVDVEDVEAFLKKQLGSKIGYATIPQEKDTDGYYHLWGFTDQTAYNDYITDPDANGALRLVNVAIPLLEEQGGVSNIVRLTRISEGTLVTSKPIASVEVSYLWQQYNPITQETTDQDEDATIVVSCRTQTANGAWGAWDSSKEFTVNIQSGQAKVIDLSQLLTSDATYQIRLISTGETSGLSASPVTMTIVYSNVDANYEGKISTVYQGDNIQLPFRISGSVQKQLRIKINGYTKNYTLGNATYIDNTYAANIGQAEFTLTRGAVKAEAWIAFGEGYTAETEHQEFQFIYIPAGDTSSTPILAVTDVMDEFQNWTRTTIFRYAIYNPQQNETALNITLQDRDTGQVYIQKSEVCTNGEDYAFDENFAMEYEGDDPPVVINAQAIFTNGQGVTFGNTLNFAVDNSENFAPTKGANVVVSAEKRSIVIDGVGYNLDDLLSNTNDTNTGWGSNLETDSTGALVNVPVLSIGAGNRFTLPYELFDENTGQNANGVEGSMTVEFDIKVKNIVGNSPVIDASAPFGSAYTGLKFYPTRAVCLTRNNYAEDICDVYYQEEVREHIAVNIIRNLRGEGLNLVRIYVNGNQNRPYMYTSEDRFVPIGVGGAQNIVIGSDDADVDIYGIRIYKSQQLGSTQIQNDYMAGMPTIEDKKLFKRFNSIFNGSEIGYDLCNAMGLNTILRRIPEGGHYPSRENQSKQKNVTVDVRIYSERGNADSLDTKHSGTFTGMTDKGQGTSAKGYYWWNITDGFEDDVEITAEEYDANNPTHYEDDGAYFKKISYFNSLDSVSQVYASEYELEEGRGGISKIVGKCNYASPMQSHKLGAIWAYDELWQALVNNGSDGRPVLKNTHACCYEKPFLCFYQIGNGNPVFCGFQTWGSGKGDKKTFGYDKKKSPDYLCVSGADNGAIAALYQMPWIVRKNAQGAWEGNIYAKSVTINTGDIKNGYCYKSGSSDTLSFEVEIGSKYDGGETDKGVLRIEDEAKGGTENTLYTHFADFANFVFACSPLLKPYAGTEAQLIAASDTLIRDHQYWIFNPGTERFNVYYFNPATAKFEKIVKVPTAWGSDGRATAYGSSKLTEQLAGVTVRVETISGLQNMTLENAMSTLGTADMNVLNDLFSQARVSYFAAHAAAYIDIPDIIFHQAFIKLEAGTDNRTKNTYPWIDPAIDKLVRWKQDDLDTIKKTDNQGRQTKPYYVLEHTKDGNGSNYWNGENNILFTLVERAYPDRMRNMMRDMFTLMAQIAGSVEEYMQQRFYWVQEYFPAVAYNETSRVLYEVAQVKLMNGQIDVSQDPITQAVGNQLECEKQFMNQRLPMLMSWCEYETGGDGTLSFRSVNNQQGQSPTYDIEYTAYQYIYPKLAIGGNIAALYAKKNGGWVNQGSEPYLCAPGETVRFVANTDSNTQFTMRWMHFAKSIGNLGNLPCGEDGNVNITGKRLRTLECWAENGAAIEFHPRGLTISNCRNLEHINLTNASSFAGIFSADLPRLKSLLLSGSSYTSVTLPQTSTLTEVALPGTINSIVVEGQPNLENLTIDSVENLYTIKIVGEHKLQSASQTLVERAAQSSANLSSIIIDNVKWESFSAAYVVWMAGVQESVITGIIDCSSASGTFTFEQKRILASRYGDIDSDENNLHITYRVINITQAAIAGKKYIDASLCTDNGDGTYTYSGLSLTTLPSTGNNVQLVDGDVNVEWSMPSNPYATISNTRTGELRITSFSAEDIKFEVSAILRKIDGTELEVTYIIGFYKRMPKLGDFAYLDGTFDDAFDKTKDLAGAVFARLWYQHNPNEPLPVGTSNPILAYEFIGGQYKIDSRARYMKLLIVSKEYLSQKSTDGNGSPISSGMAWGLYPDQSSGVNGFSTDEMQPILDLINERNASALSSMFDLADLQNITSSGMYDGNGNSTRVYADAVQADMNSETDYENGGFRERNTPQGAASNTAMAQWNGKANTKKIVEWANTILNTFISENYEAMNPPANLQELADYMYNILYNTVGDGTKNKYYQFAYPAAYACYLYEPKASYGEVDEQYKRGEWFLPSAGELARLYHHFNISRQNPMTTTNTADNTRTPSADYANYDIEQGKEGIDAWNPIFAKLYQRIAAAGGSASAFVNISASIHWSSLEYNSSIAWYVGFNNSYIYYVSKYASYSVRPVVAYIFKL